VAIFFSFYLMFSSLDLTAPYNIPPVFFSYFEHIWQKANFIRDRREATAPPMENMALLIDSLYPGPEVPALEASEPIGSSSSPNACLEEIELLFENLALFALDSLSLLQQNPFQSALKFSLKITRCSSRREPGWKLSSSFSFRPVCAWLPPLFLASSGHSC
jgi:hypothetical protein